MEPFLILSHIVCGGAVLLLGIVQMLNRKAGKNHRLVGKIYVGAMWWVCLSALCIISFYRFSAFLMVIAVLTFYASFTGVRVLKRNKEGRERWYDWVVAILTTGFGLGLVGYGVFVYVVHAGNVPFLILCLLFGSFTSINALRDLRFFIKKDPKTSFWWIRQHIGAMGGSYIAAVTAFAVQNPEIFLPNRSHQWLLWILPTVIGNPIIVFAIKRTKRRFSIPAG